MFKPLSILLLLFCSTLATATHAVPIGDLYQGKGLASNDIAASQMAALGEVLLKVTGSSDALTNPTIAAAKAELPTLVTRYSYQTIGTDKYLFASFDAKRVNLLAANAQLPLLGATRPQIALWIVVDNGDRQILADQSADGWSQSLREAADRYGLPLTLPIMDLDESANVSASDIVGRFVAPLQGASQRYGAEMILLGTLSGNTLAWELHALRGAETLLTQGTASGTQAEVSDRLLRDLFNWALSNYGTKVGAGGTSSTVMLEISDLEQLKEIAQLQTLLNGMASVSQVELVEVEGNRITLNVVVIGGSAELQRLLQLEPRLALSDSVTAPAENTLYYRWGY